MKHNKIFIFLSLFLLLFLIKCAYSTKEFFDVIDSAHKNAGIKKKYIPKEDEDLYVLKSSIVPPICPKCPDMKSCQRSEPHPPCPPCGRCPEPAFECKKVPNYSVVNDPRSLNNSAYYPPMHGFIR